jgi:hypothetical protein
MPDREENLPVALPHDPSELLRGLVPVEPGERRRVFAALLRALTDDGQRRRPGGGGGTGGE